MTSKVTRVGPYRVPTGTIVFPCLYSILMYSGNWDDPHQVSSGHSCFLNIMFLVFNITTTTIGTSSIFISSSSCSSA